MIFSRIAPSFLASLAPLSAGEFPVVPPSNRVLTVDQVKTFWVDRLHLLAPSPQAAEPRLDRDTVHHSKLQQQQSLKEEIRSGEHDLAARLVCLSHNVDSWSRLGDEAKSEVSEQHLIRLREHVARLATLEAQLESAAKRGVTDRMVEMSEEILRVKSLLARKDEMCG